MSASEGSFIGELAENCMELERRIAELEHELTETKQELAETKQYLAVAEGQPEGGPPGWVFRAGRPRWENMWVHTSGSKVFRVRPRGKWQWDVNSLSG